MSWYSRLRNALSSRQLDDEIAEELQNHIDALAQSLKATGLSEAEALRKARLQFGHVIDLRERTRETRLASFAESILHDVRYALRGMKKAPGFYTTAVLSLALAIGAVTAIYSILAAAVLRPLPVRHPEQLITLSIKSPFRPNDANWREGTPFSYPEYQELQRAAVGSADLQLFSYSTSAELTGLTARANSLVQRQYISGGGFSMLGVAPAFGRLLQPSDDRLPEGSSATVISYDFWKRHYNGDRQVLGRKLRVEDKVYEVVGVAPAGFFGIEPGKFVDLWVPAASWSPKVALTSRRYNWLSIFGRLRSGTLEQLAAKLQSIHLSGELLKLRDAPPNLPERFKREAKAEQLAVLPGEMGRSMFRRQFREPVWIVFAVSVSLGLIACANIASLLLARGTARGAEMAIRISLGASKARLMRQMLTESLLLALGSGAVGWLLARFLAPSLVSLLSTASDPVRFVLLLDTKTLLFCIFAALAAALLFGALPALQASRTAPMLSLRSSSGQAGKLRLGRWMVSAQVAGAFCLVAFGAAFSFTLSHLISRDKGFDAHNVTLFDVAADRTSAKPGDADKQTEQLLNQIEHSPGIESVGAAAWPIYSGSSMTNLVFTSGQHSWDRGELYYPVTPHYFSAMRTELLAGRDLDEHDSQTKQPIATVVNAVLAQRYFGTVNAVGKTFERPGQNNTVTKHQIVGVVENAFFSGPRKGVAPIVYMPLAGNEGLTRLTVYARSSLPSPQVTRLVEQSAGAVGAHIRSVQALDTLVGNSILREKLLAGLGAIFGFLSLLLAAIGVFGLLNYSVARRTKELGIRAALGATRSNLVRLVARDLATIMSIGVLVGLAVALSLMPLLRSLLFGVETFDASVMLTAAACFLLAAFVAGGIPAHRAASINPNVALRDQ